MVCARALEKPKKRARMRELFACATTNFDDAPFMASPSPRAPARSIVPPQFAPGERFLTVGVVAEYFGVTEVTIKNWVDGGQLLAARTVGGHRRIAASSVAKLLEEQGLPVPAGIARRKPVVVLLDNDHHWIKQVKRALSARTRVEVEGDSYAALLMVARLRPDVVVVDLQLPHGEGRRVISALRTDAQTKPIDVIAIGATAADNKSVAPLLAAATARGNGSLAYYRRSDTDAFIDAVMRAAERPTPPPRARRR